MPKECCAMKYSFFSACNWLVWSFFLFWKRRRPNNKFDQKQREISGFAKLFSWRQTACVGGFWWVLAGSNPLFWKLKVLQENKPKPSCAGPATSHNQAAFAVFCSSGASFGRSPKPLGQSWFMLGSDSSSHLKPRLKTKQMQLWTLTWVEIMLRAKPFRALALMCKTVQVLFPPHASHNSHHQIS